jgi:hypothetical protein
MTLVKELKRKIITLFNFEDFINYLGLFENFSIISKADYSNSSYRPNLSFSSFNFFSILFFLYLA